jgi:hypothetical protein
VSFFCSVLQKYFTVLFQGKGKDTDGKGKDGKKGADYSSADGKGKDGKGKDGKDKDGKDKDGKDKDAGSDYTDGAPDGDDKVWNDKD